MISKLFQPVATEVEMTQEEICAETERVLDVAQKLTWGSFFLMLISL